MSRSELNEMAELDELSLQLEAAGRRAERVLPRDPAREQEIVGRIRAQLLGPAAEPGDDERDHVVIPLRPIVRPRLDGVRFSRSLVAALAACIAVVSLAVGAPLWLPRPAATSTVEPSTPPTSSATLSSVIGLLPSPGSTFAPQETTTPSPTGSTSPSPAGSTPTRAPTLPPTPTPTATPATLDMGPLSVTANADGTYTISWNAYTGPLSIGAYALCYTTNENVQFGYVEGFGGVISVSKTANSWTGTFPWAATLRVKVETLYFPPTAGVQKAGETQVSIIPYTGASPSPTATLSPSATPSPPPVVPLGDFITVQDNHNGTFTLTWNAYTGPLSVAYLIGGTTAASGSFGYFEDGGYWSDSNLYDQTWTGPIAPGSWRIKVEAISTSTGTVIKAAETTIYFFTVT